MVCARALAALAFALPSLTLCSAFVPLQRSLQSATFSSSSSSSSRRGASATASTRMAVPLPEVQDLQDLHNLASGYFAPLLSEEMTAAAPSPVGYSQASYFTSLGLYLLSFPGLWSVIKRATKTKYKDRVYVVPGPSAVEGARPLKQTAAEIVAYFNANNYVIKEAGEEITFEGNVAANKGQAFFLVFCTFLCLGTLALVLQIQFPDPGAYWYLITLISPYAGIYYWQNANRQEKARVRIETSADETEAEIKILGGEEELDRMSKALGYMEKGKIRVKGLLEQE
jgi:hypothetical protein